MATKKLKVSKVQEIVNKAIRERDGECVVRDGRHSCAGERAWAPCSVVPCISTWVAPPSPSSGVAATRITPKKLRSLSDQS